MNYIREINAFYDWLETNGLDASCIALWHALMAIANKAGWPEEFAVAISVLQAKTGMNKKAVERARNRLEQAGLISWRSRRGNQSAIYSIKSFTGDPQNVVWVENDPQNVSQSVPQNVPQDVLQGVSQSVAITKLNETKQDLSGGGGDHARTRAEIVQAYEQIYGTLPNPVQVDDLAEYVEKGMETELVIRALRKARLKAKHVDYALGTLQRQFERGIRTVAQAELDDASRESAAGGMTVEYTVRRGTGPPTGGPNGRTRSITGGKVGRV